VSSLIIFLSYTRSDSIPMTLLTAPSRVSLLLDTILATSHSIGRNGAGNLTTAEVRTADRVHRHVILYFFLSSRVLIAWSYCHITHLC
jgi:hypothetical protein